jgi:hypothetical protein
VLPKRLPGTFIACPSLRFICLLIYVLLVSPSTCFVSILSIRIRFSIASSIPFFTSLTFSLRFRLFCFSNSCTFWLLLLSLCFLALYVRLYRSDLSSVRIIAAFQSILVTFLCPPADCIGFDSIPLFLSVLCLYLSLSIVVFAIFMLSFLFSLAFFSLFSCHIAVRHLSRNLFHSRVSFLCLRCSRF